TLVRYPRGQQVVYAPRGGVGDHRNTERAQSSLPRRRGSQEEGIAGCPRLASFPKGLAVGVYGCAGQSMERVTSPPPRSGVPLHHRTGHLPQRAATSFSYVQKTQLLASYTLSVRAPHPGNTNSPKQSKPMETSY